ncbi:ABC transporter permease [Chryseobacterium sp. Mn2064]|uniref:ABC transporter permease n=1 Tax=Chryseobacterium sp. Mn2064 TaxID=3395263 RepID=UPI003BE49F4B
MNRIFIHALESEWLKRKGSLASRIIIIGACFTPIIIIAARLIRYDQLKNIYSDPLFWDKLWVSAWESMAIFFLPLGAILFTALMTQLEYRNNAWKQWHTLPLGYSTIYFSKLLIILIMMIQFILLFTIGVILSGFLPALITGTPMSFFSINRVLLFLSDDLKYFVCLLPVVIVQYIISILNRNFLVAVGSGFLLWVAALSVLSSYYSVVFPYTYVILQYLHVAGKGVQVITSGTLIVLSLGWALILTVVGFICYRFKKEKI